jgi:hypothetical protein
MKHCSDVVLLAHLDGELPRWRSHLVANHLERCWQCRTRQFEIEERVHAAMRGVIGHDLIPPERVEAAKRAFQAKRSAWEGETAGRSWKLVLFERSWRRPAAFGMATQALMLCVLILWQYVWPKPILAAPLLERSARLEEIPTGVSPQVLHRSLHLEERSHGTVRRRRIEVWQELPTTSPNSLPRRMRTRRVFDENGQLLSCDWTTQSGARLLFRRGAAPVAQPEPVRAAVLAPDSIDTAGQMELSAKEFSSLVGDVRRAVVEETPATFVVRYQAPSLSAGGSSRLVNAALVLSRPDLRPVEQSLIVGKADNAREYRLFETGFARYPSAMVDVAVFRPDPELTVTPGAEPIPEIPLAPSPLPASQAPVLPPPPAPPVQVGREVEIISLLARANITLGDQTGMNRMPDGTLMLSLTLDNQQQVQRALAALAPLMNDSSLKVQFAVRTPPATAAFPSAAVADRARRAKAHALALRQVGGRFTPAEAASMDAATRRQWLTVLGRHAQAFGYETMMLIEDLKAAFPGVPMEDDGQGEAEWVDSAHLGPAVDHLAALGSQHEEIFLSALSGSRAIEAQSLAHSLRRAMNLAGAIRAAVAEE